MLDAAWTRLAAPRRRSVGFAVRVARGGTRARALERLRRAVAGAWCIGHHGDSGAGGYPAPAAAARAAAARAVGAAAAGVGAQVRAAAVAGRSRGASGARDHADDGLGDFDDQRRLEACSGATAAQRRAAPRRAPSARSWAYWHYRLGRRNRGACRCCRAAGWIDPSLAPRFQRCRRRSAGRGRRRPERRARGRDYGGTAVRGTSATGVRWTSISSPSGSRPRGNPARSRLRDPRGRCNRQEDTLVVLASGVKLSFFGGLRFGRVAIFTLRRTAWRGRVAEDLPGGQAKGLAAGGKEG